MFDEREGLLFNSVRLDMYYSYRKNLREFGDEVGVFVLPMENLDSFGQELQGVLPRFVDDLDGARNQYFHRELSESCSAAN